MGKECRWREAVPLIRLHILVEGQTEEDFVNGILAPDLGNYGVFADAHRITTGRRHGQIFRGGLTNYDHLARDLVLWMKQDGNKESWFTTMVDFYALPDNFPGRKTIPTTANAFEKVAHLENEFREDIAKRMDGLPVSRRFVPYIQIHEFESLLFSDTACFEEAFPDSASAIAQLSEVRTEFPTPEHINDSLLTAPSKRILHIFPDYQKAVAGILIAQRIGLTRIRSECQHFNDWLDRLVASAADVKSPDQAGPRHA